jgi:hypothetical protein
MKYSLEDGLLLIRGDHSFLLVGIAEEQFSLCIETSTEEFCQGVVPGDVIAVSAPEGGPVEPALMLMELVRTWHVPLLVLPKDHPGSRRISRVVSVAPEIHTSCSIRRGTHPGQHLICSSDELAGMVMRGTGRGVEILHLPEEFTVSRVNYQISTQIS